VKGTLFVGSNSCMLMFHLDKLILFLDKL